MTRIGGPRRASTPLVLVPRPHLTNLEHLSGALQAPTPHLTRALAQAPLPDLPTRPALLLAHIHLVLVLTPLERVLVARELQITAAADLQLPLPALI